MNGVKRGLVWVDMSGRFAANEEWWLVTEDRECVAIVERKFGTSTATYSGRRFLDISAAKAVAQREAEAKRAAE